MELRTRRVVPVCVDNECNKDTFGLDVTRMKDPSQRKTCGWIVSKDIGMYSSCLFGYMYCYATNSFDQARINYERHDLNLPSLIGVCDAKPN